MATFSTNSPISRGASTVDVAAGTTYAIQFSVDRSISVTKAAWGSNTISMLAKVVLYRVTDGARLGGTDMAVTVGGSAFPTWLTLTEPVTLAAGVDYRFAVYADPANASSVFWNAWQTGAVSSPVVMTNGEITVSEVVAQHYSGASDAFPTTDVDPLITSAYCLPFGLTYTLLESTGLSTRQRFSERRRLRPLGRF